jgi:hypothetical protein
LSRNRPDPAISEILFLSPEKFGRDYNPRTPQSKNYEEFFFSSGFDNTSEVEETYGSSPTSGLEGYE